MATTYWLGTADAVAQVTTVTVGGTLAGETFTISVNGKTMASHTDSTTTIADTVAALVAVWNASTNPYASGITAADSSPSLTLTADTAGVPFTVALNTPGGAATFGQAATTASAGPNDWSTAANWSGGAVPVDDDDVIIANTETNICWGLDQSAVTLDSLMIDSTFEGRIGLDYMAVATSADGETTDSGEVEYRGTYLQIGVAAADGPVTIGRDLGGSSSDGSDRIMLDLGATAALVEVHNTAATTADSGRPAVRLKANSGSTVVYVRSAPAGVGIAADAPGETSTVSKLSISDTSSNSVACTGPGTTITTWEQSGGVNTLRAAATVTTVTVDDGELDTEGDFTITTLNNDGGTVRANHKKTSGSAITTANLTDGTTYATGSNQARTWDLVNKYSDATLEYDSDVLTITTLNEP